jgi:hypothetical protein
MNEYFFDDDSFLFAIFHKHGWCSCKRGGDCGYGEKGVRLYEIVLTFILLTFPH